MITVSTYQKFRTKLSRPNIYNRIKIYGFIECANILVFLNYVCDGDILDNPSLRYIHGKVSACLNNHLTDTNQVASNYRNDQNDNSYYFQDLRVLRDELEFIISLDV